MILPFTTLDGDCLPTKGSGNLQSTIDWDWKDCHDLDACKPYLSFHDWWYYFDSNSGMSTFLFSCSWNTVCRHLGSLTVTLRWIHVWFLDQDFFGETVTPTTTGTTTTSTGSTKGSLHSPTQTSSTSPSPTTPKTSKAASGKHISSCAGLLARLTVLGFIL